MPRDGSGNYTLPAVYLAETGEVIRATQHNSPLEDVAVALSGSLPRNGSAPMTGNLPLGGNKITGAADAEVAADLATLGQLITAMMTREQYFLPEFTTYIRMEPVVGGVQGIVGESLKYTDWWITETKIHRWYRPAFSFLTSIDIGAVSGGGGGGSSGPAWETASTGAGGAGGALAWKNIAANVLPDSLVIIVGKGGLAGGWDKPVHFPEDGDFPSDHPEDFVPGQGVIFEVGSGGDGDFTAVFDAAVWDALGANDSARMTAFRALSYAAKKAATIMLCTGGQGGLNSDDGDAIEALAGEASGGDHNRNGSDSSGGGYITNHDAWKLWFEAISADPDTTERPPHGGIGAGGSAGGRALNDGLWENHAKPMAGYFGQLAGAGGSPKTSDGNHDGSHGGPFGGGGSGGQAGSWQWGRVLPGGFGGWGGVRLVCNYRL